MKRWTWIMALMLALMIPLQGCTSDAPKDEGEEQNQQEYHGKHDADCQAGIGRYGCQALAGVNAEEVPAVETHRLQ